MAAAPPGPANGILMHGEAELEDAGCGCFRRFWLKGPRLHISDYDDQSNYLLPERGREPQDQSWVVKQVNKLREMSELIAGPKWKNFIRRVGAYFNHSKKRKAFRYDSHDYALNFDDGIHDDEDEDGVPLAFSSRFAPPVVDKANSHS